ncbi:MAG: iron ABC transporter permease [Dehalococcoidia bacterium]|nr:iron ABC transporter permease [Dehalococcoidia bacterium]
MAVSVASLRRIVVGRLDARVIIVSAAVLIASYLVLVPLAMLVYSSFTGAAPGATGPLTLEHYATAFADTSIWKLLGTTMVFALGSGGLAFVIGTILAWLCERTNMPFKSFFYALTLARMMIPGVIGTIAWIFLLGPRNGMVNRLLMQAFGLSDAPFDIFTLPGMIWVEGLSLTPLTFLLMGAAFRSMDPSLEESATMSGSSALTTMRRVTLRLALPAALSVILIMGIRGMESFEVPALIGIPAGIYTFISAIYIAVRAYPQQYGVAGALSMLVMVISVVGITLHGRATSKAERFSTVTGKGFRPRVIDIGVWRWIAAAASFVFFLGSLGLPLFILFWASLFKFYQLPSLEALSQATFFNYSDVLSWSVVQRSIVNTIIVAIVTTAIVMTLTSIMAWLVVKTRLPGRMIIDNLVTLPIIFPGLIVGLALLWTYLVLPVPVYGTIWIIVISFVTRFMPYGMRSCSTSMIQIHRELEEASLTSGASWLQTFTRVFIPLLRPGLFAGGTFVVLLCIRELSSAALLWSPGSEVLSIQAWQMWEHGNDVQLAALGIMMTACLGILVAVIQKFGGGIQGHA